MRMLLAILLILIVLYAAAALFIGRTEMLAMAFGPVRRGTVDFPTLRKNPNPNQFLVCPEGYCVEPPDMIAPTFSATPEQLRDRWVERIGSQDRVRMIAGDAADLQYDFEERTFLMGFPDTITVRFLPAEEGSTLAVYSRSHYGKSDLGVNGKRIRRWLDLLAD